MAWKLKKQKGGYRLSSKKQYLFFPFFNESSFPYLCYPRHHFLLFCFFLVLTTASWNSTTCSCCFPQRRAECTRRFQHCDMWWSGIHPTLYSQNNGELLFQPWNVWSRRRSKNSSAVKLQQQTQTQIVRLGLEECARARLEEIHEQKWNALIEISNFIVKFILENRKVE